MNCPSPITIKPGVHVPCGSCGMCLARRRDDWTIRLYKEWQNSSSARFVTLTYNEVELPKIQKNEKVSESISTLDKEHLQLFLKRLRAVQERSGINPPKIRFYACGEYGTEFQRPHYHVLLFNATEEVIQKIDKIWSKGHVDVRPMGNGQIHYVSGYMMALTDWSKDDPRQKPFQNMSRRPGIGACYLDDPLNIKYHRKGEKKFSIRHAGYEKPLPRYYRERLFTQLEREVQREKQIADIDKNDIQQDDRDRLLADNPAALRRDRVENVKQTLEYRFKKSRKLK